MKAICVHEFGDPDVMGLEEVDLPSPGDDEVIVDIKAVGVNPVDTYIRAGWYGPKKFPFTPGFDAAGVVAEIGSGVEPFSAGQRVYVSGAKTGTYAQQALCKSSCVHPLPEAVSFEQGAALGVPYSTAWRALFQRAGACKGETVLIHGASGGVGLAAVQLAKAAGLYVIATAGSDEGRQAAADCGAEHVLDHHDHRHYDKIMELTEARGVDVVLEMLANVNLGNVLTVTGKHGRVAVIGSRGTVEINPRDMMAHEVSVLGVMGNLATAEEKAAAFAGIEAGLQDGSLGPVIAMQLPLEQAPKAHVEVMESLHHGKIILIP
ncbi:MAG: NADPH:quinone reductase [Planctomycetota bacterium]|jgi:NADPH2:quinone reductase